MEKYHYVGLKYLLTQKCIMDFKLLFEDFPEKIIPYDYDRYFSNPDRFVMVTTNCLTGKAEYLEEKSSSARVIVEYAMSLGYEKLVVVLTRNTPQNWLLYTRKVTILPLIRSKRQYIYRIFLYRHLLWL